MAACWASQFRGMSTRIIDEKPHRTETGHADGIHSRTLEIFDSFGMADPILRKGVREVEMSYWAVNEDTENLECQHRVQSQPEGLSRFPQTLLNQGEVEQVMLDYLEERGRVRVERQKRAERIYFTDDDNDAYPVVVETKALKADRMMHLIRPEDLEEHAAQVTEVIHARYIIACDGAKSLAREQLGVQLEARSTDSMWGVIDIVPITDFPDIRQSCAIHSDEFGSVMTAPRENQLVRFYIQLKGDSDLERKALSQSNETPDALIQLIQRALHPYTLTYKYCDWWSIYPIKQCLANQFQVKNRAFLAGDAAHTHSPKAGQGMNISIQDTYNLVWKLGSVVTGTMDSKVLQTYQLERHPVAEELMAMDSRLVHAYEGNKASISEVSKVREGYTGFMSGVEVTYQPNVLVSSGERGEWTKATNIKLGMRLGTVPVLNQASACTIQLPELLSSNGAWRLLVFSGDLQQRKNVDRLTEFAERPGLQEWQHPIDVILIHPGPRTSVNLLELPEMFHPFDKKLGWDYGRVFADDGAYGGGNGHAYEEYGIDRHWGCLALCRPDQHVAWIGGLEQASRLDAYFSALHSLDTLDN